MDQIKECCKPLCYYHGVFNSVSAENAQCKSVQVTNFGFVNG